MEPFETVGVDKSSSCGVVQTGYHAAWKRRLPNVAMLHNSTWVFNEIRGPHRTLVGGSVRYETSVGAYSRVSLIEQLMRNPPRRVVSLELSITI